MSYITLGYRNAPHGFGNLLPSQVLGYPAPPTVVKTASYQATTSVSPGVVDKTVAAPTYQAVYQASTPSSTRQTSIAETVDNIARTAADPATRARSSSNATSASTGATASSDATDYAVLPSGSAPDGSGTPMPEEAYAPIPSGASAGLPWWAWALIGIGGGLVVGKLVAG
jgi:hypothetical protein